MPKESNEEIKPITTVPPVSTGTAPHQPEGTGTSPDGNHEPFDEPVKVG
ncbi:hypothetical protein [Amycolatopsis sp. PS_44_ISF1]|nr:hypothetical protein [Amycolatopsis sp. PS_44_ISF1]MDT8910190.1 hypothetical protein [Amycolatopsis sp. PS_44_ISF1]MDT8916387.1 hypothetical protein [Amycolatopsis sp. PS_44_ISF1]